MTPMLGIMASQISGHLFTLSGNYDALATVTVPSGGLSSITFAGIPQTGYSHLQIRGISKGTSSATNAILRFNGDTASNYSFHILYGNSGGAQVTGAGGNSFIYIGTQSATANTFSTEIIDILDYSSTSKSKTVRALCGYENNSAGEVGLFSGGWFNSSTGISSITLSLTATFSEGSTFSLYGVK